MYANYVVWNGGTGGGDDFFNGGVGSPYGRGIFILGSRKSDNTM